MVAAASPVNDWRMMTSNDSSEGKSNPRLRSSTVFLLEPLSRRHDHSSCGRAVNPTAVETLRFSYKRCIFLVIVPHCSSLTAV